MAEGARRRPGEGPGPPGYATSPTTSASYGKLGRTSAAGLVRRARELGLEVPANVEKSELRAFVEEAERRQAEGCDPAAATAGALPAPCAVARSSSPASQHPGSVAELKGRLRELGFEIPSNIIEKSELRALVEEAERHRAAAEHGPTSPSCPSSPQPRPRSLRVELPPPWRRKESRSRPGYFYYAHAETGETTWEPWFRQELQGGRHLYVNVETGESTLEPPTRRWKERCAEEPLRPAPAHPPPAAAAAPAAPLPAAPPGEAAVASAEPEHQQAASSSQAPALVEKPEEEEDPPEPCRVDYRDNAFRDGLPRPLRASGSGHPARQPSASPELLPVACTQGDQGVKSLSVKPPTNDWPHSAVLEVVQGSSIAWVRGPLIGRGSLGRVFKARDQDTGQILAVKEVPINRRDAQDEEFRASLENEVSIMRDLKHPHIVAYLGHDYIDGCLYMYLEHMAGGTLTQALNEFGPFEEFLIARYSYQLLQGLEYLHTREPSIIHRDIKGSNVLIGSDNEVKLADFGCSKRTDETLTHTMRGSIPWMAPEVIAHSRYGRGADIWSFGCVQIEMGTANVPWGRFEHQMQALVRIGLSQETPPLPPAISTVCEDFILLCVRRDVATRPCAAELLGHEFLRAAAAEAVDT